MTIPEQLPAFVKRFEGLARIDHATGLIHMYRDGEGNPTIGWGHLCSADQPPITRTQADALLAADLQNAVDVVARLCPRIASDDDKLTAVADFVFNFGETKFKASHLCLYIQQGRDDLAAGEFRKWDHEGIVTVSGLTERREAERKLYTGE